MSHTRGKLILRVLRAALFSAIGGSGSMLRRVSFWTAILLPLLYLPLMFVHHPWVVDAANFTKVVAIHIASIAFGKDHRGGGPER